FRNVCFINVGVLDFRFHILFVVSEKFIDVAVALDVGVVLQLVERGPDSSFVRGDVEIAAVNQKDCQIARRGLELLDELEQEQSLEQPHGQRCRSAKISFGGLNGVLQIGTQGVANALEHAVEGGEPTNRLGGN